MHFPKNHKLNYFSRKKYQSFEKTTFANFANCSFCIICDLTLMQNENFLAPYTTFFFDIFLKKYMIVFELSIEKKKRL
jgi:hypothetical protein